MNDRLKITGVIILFSYVMAGIVYRAINGADKDER